MSSREIMIAAIGFVVGFVLTFCFAPTSANAAAKWNGPVQCSYYTLAENGSATASGVPMTNRSMGVAVPMETVVSKSRWKRGSKSFRRTHFYYGERIRLRHGKRYCTVKVVDCGAFGSYGCRYKGKWRKRLFDLQPAVKRKLHCGDVGLVRWRVVK